VIKLPDSFYELSLHLQNSPDVAKLLSELDKVLSALMAEVVSVKDTDDLLRLQGKIQVLDGILHGFRDADSVVRKISGASGPTVRSIT
jgi:hypothetical protein